MLLARLNDGKQLVARAGVGRLFRNTSSFDAPCTPNPGSVRNFWHARVKADSAADQAWMAGSWLDSATMVDFVMVRSSLESKWCAFGCGTRPQEVSAGSLAAGL